MSESRHIPEDFFDKEYRHAYAEDFLNTQIATQIRVLREQRGLTQEELAQRIGTKQSGISRLENVNYSAWKVETLKKIARAFDVVFICGFVSFSSLLDEAAKFGRKALERPSFDEDIAALAKGTIAAQTTMSLSNLTGVNQLMRIHSEPHEEYSTYFVSSNPLQTRQPTDTTTGITGFNVLGAGIIGREPVSYYQQNNLGNLLAAISFPASTK